MVRLIINSRDIDKNNHGYVKPTHKGTSSNFIYDIGYNYQYKGYKIHRLVIPYSWYVIKDKNNSVGIVDSDSNNYTLTLSKGTYSVNSLVTEIKSKLNGLTSSDIFDVTVNSSNGKMTIINNTGNFEILFSNSLLADVLGYDKVDLDGSSSYTGSKVVNNTLSIIYLNSSKLSSTPNIRTSNSNGTVIEAIPVDITFGGYIIYSPQFKNIIKGSVRQVNRLDFFFTDEFGDILDFNGIDVLIDIELVCE